MGYRARWLAVKNAEVATCLATTGLRQKASVEGEVCDPGLYCVQLPAGWRVVMGDGWDFMDLVDAGHAKQLSKGTDALFLSTDDTSMCARLAWLRDGQESWALEYDGSNGRSEPVVTGAPPPPVAQVIDACRARQAGAAPDVDVMYEVVPEVAKALTGFRHDETLAEGQCGPGLVLEPTAQGRAADRASATAADSLMVRWLKALFGPK